MLLSHDTFVTMIVQSSVAVMTCQQVETGTPGKRSIFPTSGRGHVGVVTRRGQTLGDVTLAVVDSIKERCLQWIGRERKLTLILTLILILNTNPKH